MSTDRFEQRLPELLVQLGRTDPSDLVDDVLLVTTSMRQRPRWQRRPAWVPDGAVVRAWLTPESASGRRLVVAIAVLVALLLAVSVAVALRRSTPAPYRDVFEATGSLRVARSDPVAALLPDGRVLVAGGTVAMANGSVPPTEFTDAASAEIYDPATGRFVETDDLATASIHGPGVVLPDGRLLLIGSGRTMGPDGAGQVFDPVTGTFSMLEGLRADGQVSSMLRLPDGRVLLLPFGAGSAWVFDARQGRLTKTGPIAEGQPVADEADWQGTVLRDGQILVSVGASGPIERFDPAAGTFGQIVASGSPADAAWTEGTSTSLSDGRVLLTGDHVDATGRLVVRAEIYDPASNTIRSVATTDRPAGPTFLLRDGRVLMLGVDPGEGGRAAFSLYDPRRDAWTAAPPLTTPRIFFSAIALEDGGVMVVGGARSYEDQTPVPDVDVYR